MGKELFSPDVFDSYQESLPLVAECSKCGLYRKCQSPMMKRDGEGRVRVLIVAEAPGENEDKMGKPLIGKAGNELLRILSTLNISMRRDCWLTNALICRPVDEKGGNRTPTNDEIRYCSPNLRKTVEELKPDVIVPMGLVAIKSVTSLAWRERKEIGGKQSQESMGKWAGWNIPSVKLNAWICPTFHPSFLLREQKESRTAELHVTKHLVKAFTHGCKPYKTLPDWTFRVTVEMNPSRAAEMVDDYRRLKVPLAFDLETTTLKPDGPHAEILCCSVSDGKTSVSFPWLQKTRMAMKELIRSNVPKIGANLQFEERWMWKKLGCGVKNWMWDTVLGAHWLDCHSGICSVKFQAFVRLGVEDWSVVVDQYMKSGKGENSPNRLREVDPVRLMNYCGLDSLYEVLVAEDQMREGEE